MRYAEFGSIREKMKKRIRSVIGILCLLSVIVMLCGGCASSATPDITSDWKISEFTVNGKTTKEDETPFLVKVFTSSQNPRFVCRDGVNCVFSLGDKKHPGTVTKEGDQYIINYADTTKLMYGTISGNKLMLKNESGTLELIFETK